MSQLGFLRSFLDFFSPEFAMGPDVAACQALGNIFNNVTIYPTDTKYDALATENWSQTAWGSPTCIFQPTSKGELQTALPILVEANSSFAVRSGGHMPVSKAANIDKGVLIDMSMFGGTQYDAENGVIDIGAGQRWGDVYTALDPLGVTIAGGRVMSAGVGGLILGCGLSYLSDLYGLVCDNVVNFEVVLSDGSVVDANADSNSELFWALKGGSNNFGIVTAFKLRTFPIFDVWGGTKGYPFEALPDVLDALAEFQTNPEKDPYAQFNMNAYVTNTTFGVVLSLVYLKPDKNPAAFDPFYRIEKNWATTMDTTCLRTLHNLMSEYPIPSIPRVEWTTTSFVPSSSMYSKIREIFASSSAVNKMKGITAGTGIFTLQGVSARAVHEGNQKGGNALGLKPVPQSWFHTDLGWWFSEDDVTAHEAIRSLTDEVEEAAKSEDKYLPYLFMNDASSDQQVIKHYGEDNVKRLRQVQQKYDPSGVFQKLVPGGFKLP